MHYGRNKAICAARLVGLSQACLEIALDRTGERDIVGKRGAPAVENLWKRGREM